MTSSQLPNYLLSNRKRLGLSQDDLAFLLGAKSGAKVSRYERFSRNPELDTALAFEVIFQTPVRELFAGLYQRIQKEVVARAKIRAALPEQRKPSWRTVRKRQALAAIAALESRQ